MYNFNENLLEWKLRFAQEKQHDPIKQIIQQSIQSSCTVLASGDGKQWTGSGFHVGKGIIVTAAHVTEGAVDVNLSFDGKILYPASIIIAEPNIDVALLHCPQIAKIINVVRLANSDTAEVGDIIATVTSPEGWNDTATVGRISNIHQGLGEYAPSPAWNDIMFIDADILQGSSGGMVIGTDGLIYGSVMGVTGQNAEMGQGQRAVCPSNKIRALLSQINQKL
jgi:S1-C subfamily serine protease